MMISMLKTEAEKKDDAQESILDRPDFPYGLSLNLEEEVVKKLEMKKPTLGQKMKLHAIVEVTGMHKDRSSENFSVTLQITDMEIDVEIEKKTAEEVLFGGNDS